MISRAVYSVPIFFVPAFWNLAFRKSRINPKPGTLFGNFVEILGITLGLAIAMPINCALYPQMSQIDINKLEPHIQLAAAEKGITILQYNKGL